MSNFIVIAPLAFVFGYCVNRSSTCAVAAMKDWICEDSPGRMIALGVTAASAALILLTCALIFSQIFHRPNQTTLIAAIGGGVLFGIGAFVNRACVFGTLHQLTNGNLNFLGTIAGMFTGIGAAQLLGIEPLALETGEGGAALIQIAIIILAIALLVFLTVRSRRQGGGGLRGSRANLAFGMAIGATGVILYSAFGPWTYTRLISDSARAAAEAKIDVPSNPLVLAVLSTFAGGFFSSIRSGTFNRVRVQLKSVAQHAAGGTILGVGAALMGGGNDFLLTYGLPSGSFSALLAYGSMATTLLAIFTLFKRSRTPVR